MTKTQISLPGLGGGRGARGEEEVGYSKLKKL